MTAPVLLPLSRGRPSGSPGGSPPTPQGQGEGRVQGPGRVRGEGVAEPDAWAGTAPDAGAGAPFLARSFGVGRCLALLHWTSADAVLVVLAFAWALAQSAGIALPWAVYAFLALGVWLGYAADRLADLERSPCRAHQTGRHAFHLRHRRTLTTVWVGGFLAAWPLAWVLLPSRAVLAGGSLAAAAALYVWWGSGTPTSGGSPPSTREGRKRRCTAVLLTAAGVWSLWTGGGGFGPPVGILAGLFAVAAWWNLTLLGYHRGSASRARARARLRERGLEGGRERGFQREGVGGPLRGLPRGSILAAALLLALPLWSGHLLLLPGAALLILGLGALAWRGDALSDDVLALVADGTLCLGFLAMGVAVGSGVG
jgi:hypothetical protein